MKKWSLQGFDQFSKGIFENAGQNLYVSAKGVMQRIWRFDVNNDGFVDLLVTNSHDYGENPPAYLIHDPAGEARIQEIFTQGGQTGAVADLNGNGYDDFVLAATHNGHHMDLASYVYFGGKDGITENRKIDLAAKGCVCCGIGDFDGDGKKEIVYLIGDSKEWPSAAYLRNYQLRIYRQTELGFRMTDYKDYPAEICYFNVMDVDGDGCDDLYCRTKDGKWLILWGGPDGFTMETATEVGPATDDFTRFDLLAYGGGNMLYAEMARPKAIQYAGKSWLFYADAAQVRLIGWNGRTPSGEEICLPIPNVMSAATGYIAGEEKLVLVQVDGLERQFVQIYGKELSLEQQFPVITPRDVLLEDFSGNGHADIVVIQGRDAVRHTTESLLFCTDDQGFVNPEPRRFVTHNCVEALTGDFDGSGKKSLIFINHEQGTGYGHIPVYVFMGSEQGFTSENRLEFPGHSAGTMMPIDFNDDGWPDLLILHNCEDQPVLGLPADLYFGGPDGFSLDKKIQIPAPLAWGGHCADLNKDGYLDVVMCCAGELRIQYGGPEGINVKEQVIINPLVNPDDGAIGLLWPALADLNGNGWLDLVVPISWQPYSRIYWGGPEGYSNERSTLLPIENALTVRVADLNKDGYPDLVFGSRASSHTNEYHEGTVTIFWGGPDGYSGYNCCVLPSYQSNCITIQDLTGDGWLDIFASSYFNKKERDINSFIYWNDHGNFSLTNRKRIFAHSSSAAWACDFNEDGYVDLFVSNHRSYGNHTGESAIWWNGPDGFSEERRSWLPTLGPHDLVPNDVGNVMTRGPEESYTTPVAVVDGLQKVGWTAEIPNKTWINCQIRTASTEEALAEAPFIGADGTENSRFQCDEVIPAELIAGKYLQIKLFFGAVNSGNSPRLTEVYAD